MDLVENDCMESDGREVQLPSSPRLSHHENLVASRPEQAEAQMLQTQLHQDLSDKVIRQNSVRKARQTNVGKKL